MDQCASDSRDLRISEESLSAIERLSPEIRERLESLDLMRGDQIMAVTDTMREFWLEYLHTEEPEQLFELARFLRMDEYRGYYPAELLEDHIRELLSDVFYETYPPTDNLIGWLFEDALRDIRWNLLAEDTREHIRETIRYEYPDASIFIASDHPEIGSEIAGEYREELLDAGISESELAILEYPPTDWLSAMDYEEEYDSVPDGWTFEHLPSDHYQIVSEILREIEETPIYVDGIERYLTFRDGDLFLIRADLADLLEI